MTTLRSLEVSMQETKDQLADIGKQLSSLVVMNEHRLTALEVRQGEQGSALLRLTGGLVALALTVIGAVVSVIWG